MLKWMAYGVLILALAGAIGLLVGAVFRSPMHVDDECEPTGHEGAGTKAKNRFSGKKTNVK